MDMYTDGLITREELSEKIGGMKQEIARLEQEKKLIDTNLSKGDQLEHILADTFKSIEDIPDVSQMTNSQLKRIIEKIEVDHQGNVDIHLRLLGELGLNETFLICDTHTYNSNVIERFDEWKNSRQQRLTAAQCAACERYWNCRARCLLLIRCVYIRGYLPADSLRHHKLHQA